MVNLEQPNNYKNRDQVVAKRLRRDTAKKMWAEGVTVDEISRTLGVIPSTVYRYLEIKGPQKKQREQIAPTDWIARCEQLESKYPAWKAHTMLMAEWVAAGRSRYPTDSAKMISGKRWVEA